MSQEKLAAMLGYSLASVRNWEKGYAPGPEALERMVSLATERNLLTLAADLKQQYGWPAAPPRPLEINARKWHEMLDYILQHGDAPTIAAVQSSLVVFFDHSKRGK